LSNDNLIKSRRGIGTLVTEHAEQANHNKSLRQAINDRLNMPEDCSIKILQRYEAVNPIFSWPAQVYPKYQVIEKLHLANDAPFAYLEMHIEKGIFDKFPVGADEKSKILSLIIASGELKLSSSNIQMTVVYATDRLAALLECAPLSALVRIQTFRCDMSEMLVVVTDAYYRSDKFLYEIVEQNVEIPGTNAMAIPDIKR